MNRLFIVYLPNFRFEKIGQIFWLLPSYEKEIQPLSLGFPPRSPQRPFFLVRPRSPPFATVRPRSPCQNLNSGGGRRFQKCKIIAFLWLMGGILYWWEIWNLEKTFNCTFWALFGMTCLLPSIHRTKKLPYVAILWKHRVNFGFPCSPPFAVRTRGKPYTGSCAWLRRGGGGSLWNGLASL